MPFPFEMPFEEVQTHLDRYVDEVCSSLQSAFMTMPKGPGFVEYSTFVLGYEALKRTTEGFQRLAAEETIQTVYEKPITLIVLRAMLGFTPSEMAEATTARTGEHVTQGAARSVDRNIRIAPDKPLHTN